LNHHLIPLPVFLHELEYFSGILFLTTNLLSTIDAAFESRIHIHLLFSTLSPDSRLKIWQKFIQRLPVDLHTHARVEIGDDDIRELAKWDLNGRQIKNALRTARTWCLCKGLTVTLERLESAIRVTAPKAGKGLDGGVDRD
jgi:AAA+ superfamily predicted ATPase